MVRQGGGGSYPFDFGKDSNGQRTQTVSGRLMSDTLDEDMPREIDFSHGVRGLHHIPRNAKVLMPVSLERSVWEYFSGKAAEKGVPLSQLVTELLKRDIEIGEALK
jgi:hypothetical protein